MHSVSSPPRALSAAIRYDQRWLQAPKTIRSRIDWVDYAKGLLIILVVYGHVLRGLQNAHIIAQTGFMDTAIYSFHMAAFFWLSGLFLGSNTDINFKQFFDKKLSKVLYPFLLWSVVQGSLSVVLAQITNSSKDMHRLLFFWLYPLDQFWFLHALILIQVLFFITKKFSWQAMLGIGAVLWLIGAYAGLDYPIANPLLNYIFVVGGWLCARYNEFDFFAKQKSYLNPLSYLPIVVIAISTYVSMHYGINILVLPALSGIFCLLQFSMLLSHFKVLPFLKTLGTHSLSIFILHTLVAAACRIMLSKFLHVNDAGIHQVFGTLTGLFIPLVILFGLQKVKLNEPLFLR